MDVVRIDKIKWLVSGVRTKVAQPLCPVHTQNMYVPEDHFEYSSNLLVCEDCDIVYELPRTVSKEKQYILDRLQAMLLKNMPVINLDDEAIPIAKDNISTKNNKYFVKSILTDSKTGLRIVIYAGEKGKNEKTQLFVEPMIKRLSFDQNNLHPSKIFAVVDVTFNDGTKQIITKS